MDYRMSGYDTHGGTAYTTSQLPKSLILGLSVSHVFVCERSVTPPERSLVTEAPRIEIPLSGCYENEIELNGQLTSVQIRPGQALFVPPNAGNLPTWMHPVRVVSIAFHRKQISFRVFASNGPFTPCAVEEEYLLPRAVTGPVAKLLDALAELHASGASCSVIGELARALLACVRESLQDSFNETTRPAKHLLDDICDYLQCHYQYEVTRESVARHFGISASYLSRVFQVQGHGTFSDYLMRVRTEQAMQLLRSAELKLDDVAAQCGYRDTAYFCRVFKRLTTLTPTDFRRGSRVLNTRAPQRPVSELKSEVALRFSFPFLQGVSEELNNQDLLPAPIAGTSNQNKPSESNKDTKIQ